MKDSNTGKLETTSRLRYDGKHRPDRAIHLVTGSSLPFKQSGMAIGFNTSR